MLCEIFSQIINFINGIELFCGLVLVKFFKDGIVKMVVFEFEKLKEQYEYLWDMLDNCGYLIKVVIIQKFFDQVILVNINYDFFCFEGDKVLMMMLLLDLFFVYKMGVKMFYYYNIRDGVGKCDDDEVQNLFM